MAIGLPSRSNARTNSRAAADCLVVDPWNALGTGQVFLFASESAALLGEPATGARAAGSAGGAETS